MTNIFTLEHIEPQILRITWDGILNTHTFREATEQRVEYAQQHVSGDYVLIFDLTHAIITMLNIPLITWAANIDPHMINTVVIGRQGVLRVVAHMLVRLSKLKVELVDTNLEALERARAVITQQTGAA